MSNRPGLIQVTTMPAAANVMPGHPALVRHRPEGRSHFDIYRTEQVPVTSILFGGGDWHWRLTDGTGAILADCGGYRNRRDCLAVVEGLRAEAGLATISEGTGRGSAIRNIAGELS